MTSKKQNNKTKNKKSFDNDLEFKQPLQALIILNNDIDTFYPLTEDKPKELIPIINTCMIQYTIDNLIESGVEEVYFVLAYKKKNYSNQSNESNEFNESNESTDSIESNELYENKKNRKIKEYLEEFEWDISVKYIEFYIEEQFINELQILRKIEKKNIIKSDPFILISSDVISNFSLKHVINLHKQRIKEKKDCMMTLCFQKVKEYSNKKSLLDQTKICLNEDNQVLYYKNDLFQSEFNNFNFGKGTCYENIIDCHIDICSLSFLIRISDEFDYKSLREDFIISEVSNVDFGRKVYGYLINDAKYYTVKVLDPKVYHKVSMDIINNKIKGYNIIDNKFYSENDEYKEFDSNVYIEKSAKIEKSVIIHSSSIIGSNTIIGKKSSITNCIIGNNCIIGENIELINTHIFDNTILENNIKIFHSIIGEKCIIKNNSIIEKGSLIGDNVILNTNSLIKEFSRISKNNYNDFNIINDNDNDKINLINIKEKNNLVKNLSFRKVLSIGSIYDDSKELFINLNEQKNNIDIKNDLKRLSISSKEELKLISDELNDYSEYINNKSSDESSDEYFVEQIIEFLSENKKNMLLELKCYLLAENKTKIDCLESLMIYIWNENNNNNDLVKIALQYKKFIDKNIDFFKFFFDDENVKKYFIKDILENTKWYNNNYEFFFYLIKIFYDNDLIENKSIMNWIKKRKIKSNKIFENKKVIEFVEWFLDDDSDDDDDSDNNDSVDDDSDDDSDDDNNDSDYNFDSDNLKYSSSSSNESLKEDNLDYSPGLYLDLDSDD